MYDSLFTWAFKMGLEIKSKNEDLLRGLIFDIRGEETPGRFLDKLTERFTEYKTNRNIALNVSMNPLLLQEQWHADKFHYMKSAILAGLLNALAYQKET